MTDSPSKLTAAAVRAELARRRITRTDFGQALGWSPSSTTRRLNGTTPFRVDELARVAAYLDVPLTALLPISDAA